MGVHSNKIKTNDAIVSENVGIESYSMDDAYHYGSNMKFLYYHVDLVIVKEIPKDNHGC